MRAHQFVIMTLNTTCVWQHPKALCSTLHFPLDSRWREINTSQDPTAIDYVHEDTPGWIANCAAQWVWCLEEAPPKTRVTVCCRCVVFGHLRRFRAPCGFLHAFLAALNNTPPLQRLRLHAHFKHQHKGRSLLWTPSEYQRMLCNAYTRAIELANADSNLGCWAELPEYQIPHLPFNRNPLLWMIRACSHVHDWSLSTLVYSHMIYVVFHVHLLCLYIGRTEGPLVTGLRKHGLQHGRDQRTAHFIICWTGLHHWTIAPLQWTACGIEACFLERSRWLRWKKMGTKCMCPCKPV